VLRIDMQHTHIVNKVLIAIRWHIKCLFSL